MTEFIKTIENKKILDKDNGQEITFVKARPSTEEEISKAELRLGIKLPTSYKDFLLYCGPANFFGLQISDLNELYQLDGDNWEMTGMIPFFTDAIERIHCFKPVTNTDEYEIYICSHDPFGYGKVADSFQEWCKFNYSMMLNFEENKPDFVHPFLTVDKDIRESWKRYEQTLPKKWYEFWK